MPTSVFTTTILDIPPLSSEMSLSLGNLTTYNEVVNKLNQLFDDQLSEIKKLTDVSVTNHCGWFCVNLLIRSSIDMHFGQALRPFTGKHITCNRIPNLFSLGRHSVYTVA